MKNSERKDQPISGVHKFGNAIVSTGDGKSVKCCKCSTTSLQEPLYRTMPLGEENAGFMCLPCMRKHEPELAKNIKTDDKDLTDLLEVITGKRNKL